MVNQFRHKPDLHVLVTSVHGEGLCGKALAGDNNKTLPDENRIIAGRLDQFMDIAM